MKQYHAILFDLDMTLLDFKAVQRLALSKIHRRFFKDVGLEELGTR